MSHELRGPEEVEEILRLAVSSLDSHHDDGYEASRMREHLLASGKELGLSPEEIAAAEEEWRRKKRDREFEEYKSRRRLIYRVHLVLTLFVVPLVAVLAWVERMDQTFGSFVLFALIAAVVWHRHVALDTESNGFQRGYKSWRDSTDD